LSPEILGALRDYGPIVLAAVGAVFTFLFGIIAFLAKLAWKQHQEKVLSAIEKHGKDIHHIRTEVAASDKIAKQSHDQIRAAVVGLREGLKAAVQEDGQLKLRVAELAGVSRHLADEIGEVAGELKLANGKLEAVFRFIDAQPRATDVVRPGPKKG
jgi:hypothetical protein